MMRAFIRQLYIRMRIYHSSFKSSSLVVNMSSCVNSQWCYHNYSSYGDWSNLYIGKYRDNEVINYKLITIYGEEALGTRNGCYLDKDEKLSFWAKTQPRSQSFSLDEVCSKNGKAP